MKRDTQKTKPNNTPCVMWNRHSSSHHRTECRTMIVLPPHNVLGFGLQRLITSEWAKKIRQIAAFHPSSNLYIRLFYAPLLKGISDPSRYHNFSGFSRLFWNSSLKKISHRAALKSSLKFIIHFVKVIIGKKKWWNFRLKEKIQAIIAILHNGFNQHSHGAERDSRLVWAGQSWAESGWRLIFSPIFWEIGGLLQQLPLQLYTKIIF